MDDQMVKELMTTVTCAVCGRRYEAGDINILYHQEQLWFISVYCQGCHTKGLVAALIKDKGDVEVVSDLTELESGRFSATLSINTDDVLDVHNFLEDFDGDFAALFGSKGQDN